ncbi:hypothetical protein GUITHDRAFT_164608 [Guillardia theta CCMP2712]|uniref:ParB-like nuclease n=1 Tax=Guillardia theta (strain CCMP2712) TaxID=905079 RepID=L1IXC3_GUITC|nr:hypothetical protein GUITHDRAFT_164608 [Guillardia theta CCMP2712]EKX40747.1 hypothetical protein GUITHDRAFT_164608 [Guillardia theta CCMP2712]|eukprot:XP_005827727.1 hypothetical protein GUITHDRAFT_164608 [Guillardia theta CCMP2712]
MAGLRLLLLMQTLLLASADFCDDFDVSQLDGSDPLDYCKAQFMMGHPPKIGTVCLARPQDAFPTQAAYGEVDAGCVQREIEALAGEKDGSLRTYLMSNTVPTVIGPSGKLYITDHHHLSRALLQSFLPYDKPYIHRLLYLCINEDLSKYDEQGFWDEMQSRQLVWLYDNEGNNITVHDLPQSVKYLKDDPYRTLAMYVRQSYGFIKCGSKSANSKFPQCEGGNVTAKPYIEFKWAKLYRAQFPLPDIYDQSDQAQVIQLQSVLGQAITISLDPRNAGQEGFNRLGPKVARAGNMPRGVKTVCSLPSSDSR